MTSKCPWRLLQAQKDFVWLQNGAVQTTVANRTEHFPEQILKLPDPCIILPPTDLAKMKAQSHKKKKKDLSSSQTSFYTPSIKSGCSYYFLQPDTLQCVLFPTARYTLCVLFPTAIYTLHYCSDIYIADILHKLTAQENTPTASAESNEKLFKDFLLTHGQYLREYKQFFPFLKKIKKIVWLVSTSWE